MHHSTLSLTPRHLPGLTVVSAAGQIDRRTVAQLRTVLLRALRHAGPDLVLDLRGVRSIDDAGTDALRRTGLRAAALGGAFTLIGVPPHLASRVQALVLNGEVRHRATVGGALTADSSSV